MPLCHTTQHWCKWSHQAESNGAAAYSTTGCQDLGGSNEYTLVSHNALFNAIDYNAAFTVMGWLKMPAGAGNGLRIMGKTNPLSTQGWDFICNGPSGNKRYYFYLFANYPTHYLGGGTDTGLSITADTWFHWAIRNTGAGDFAGISLWFNGTSIHMNDEAGTIGSGNCQTTEDLRLGWSAGTYASTGAFVGKQDQILFYNTNLSDAEIAAIANSGNSAIDPTVRASYSNCFAHYEWDGVDTLTDIRNLINVGTLTGACTNMEAGDLSSDHP